MIKFEQFEGGTIYINPRNVSFIKQNTVHGHENIVIIRIDGESVYVVGDADEVFKRLFGDEVSL